MSPQAIANLLPDGAVHQGMAGQFTGPATVSLTTLANQNHSVLVLDQVTDPRNAGAIYRSAVAFGVGGVVLQDRKAPPPFGATAKAAVGTLELLQFASVTNIANAILELREAGWTVYGLGGRGAQSLDEAELAGRRIAFVLGAEDKGLRPRVAESCDGLLQITMNEKVESLNVSVAAGIVCHARQQARRTAMDASAATGR